MVGLLYAGVVSAAYSASTDPVSLELADAPGLRQALSDTIPRSNPERRQRRSEMQARFGKRPEGPPADTLLPYARIKDTLLYLSVWYPDSLRYPGPRPTILYFHGGGWVSGTPHAASAHAERYREKGFVTISVQYRLANIPGRTIADCVVDARRALRWVRDQAASLRVNPDQIVAWGNSAGGHLAIALATLDHIRDEAEPGRRAIRPNAIIAMSAPLMIDSSNLQYIRANMDTFPPSYFSPYHHIKKPHPPTLIFHGGQDNMLPRENASRYVRKADGHKSRVFLHLVEEGHHNYFSTARAVPFLYEQTDALFRRLGWMKQ